MSKCPVLSDVCLSDQTVSTLTELPEFRDLGGNLRGQGGPSQTAQHPGQTDEGPSQDCG